MRKPSEASAKAFRAWTEAVEKLNALERNHAGKAGLDKIFGDKPRTMDKADAALKANLEAQIAGLEKANPDLLGGP
jgi:hypothetical protein